MKNEIITFNFNNNPVRTQKIDGAAWFCLKDACAALGLSNSRKTKTQLTAKGVTESYTPTNGGEQEVTFINEPNLYRLIFRSNKPQAQAFADWVYEEVLPSIRKTGSYNSVPALDAKAIGGIVKKCAAKAVKDELANVRPAPSFNPQALVEALEKARREEEGHRCIGMAVSPQEKQILQLIRDDYYVAVGKVYRAALDAIEQ